MYIHHPIYDIPDFEHVTTQNLTYYYIVCQPNMSEVGRRHDLTSLAPIYEAMRNEIGWKTH